MNNIDYPAAHSMDTDWFAIDEAGEVALMSSGESGPVPADTRIQSSMYDLEDLLDRDENGTPLFPTEQNPFPDGQSTDALQAQFLALSDLEREAIERLARHAHLSAKAEQSLEKLVRASYVSAVVLLADAADLKEFADLDGVFRLDPTRPLYYIAGNSVDAMRLLVKGRLLAWRRMNDRDEWDLAKVQGIYRFDALFGNGGAQGEGVCLPIAAPDLYERIEVPQHPRIGLPAALMNARVKEFNGEGEHPFVHMLPGVRFADMARIQLADIVPIWDWGTGYHVPDSGHSVVRRNISIVHQPQSAERDAHITKWHDAAERGDLLAQYSVAYAYFHGAQELERAVYWYREAAQQAEATPSRSPDMFENGSAAQCSLADLLERGVGAAQDYAAAIDWYLKSAAQENPVAQYRLGMMYRNGRGVAQDLTQAQAWFTKSASHGYQEAKAMLPG